MSSGTERRLSFVAVLRDEFSHPLKAFSTGLQGLRSEVDAVASSVSPLVSKLTALTAAVSAGAIGRAALNEAEASERSQQKLISALRGREEATRRITDAANELQKRTGLDNDLLVEQAAVMARLGVSAERIPRALQIAADVAAGLNLDVGTVADDLGKILTGGQSRLLATRVDVLRELRDKGLLAVGALDALEQRFQGAAAAAAAGKFGRAAADIKAIADSIAPLGDRLQEIRGGFITSLVPVAEQLGKLFDSPGARAFAKILADMSPAILKVIAGLTALIGLLTVIKIGLWFAPAVTALASLLFSLGLFLLKWGAVAAIVAAVGYGLLKLTGTFDRLAAGARRTRDEVGQIVEDIGRGRLSVGDLFDYLATRLRQGYALLNGYIFQPTAFFFVGLAKTIAGLLGTVVAGIGAIAAGLVDVLASSILLAVKAVLTTIDDLVRGLPKKVQTAIGFPDEGLASKVPDRVNALAKAADATFAAFDKSFHLLRDSIPQAIEDSRKAMAAAQAEVAGAEQDLGNRLTRRRFDSIVGEQVEGKEAIRQTKANIDALVDDLERLRASAERTTTATDALLSPETIAANLPKLRAALGQLDKETLDPVRSALLKQLDERLRAEAITTQQFLEAQRELTLGVAQDRLSAAEKAVKDQQEQIAQLEERRAAAVEASRKIDEENKAAAEAAVTQKVTDPIASMEELLDRIKATGKAKQDELEATGALVDATKILTNLEQDRQETAAAVADAEQTVAQARTTAAQGALEDVDRARERLARLGEDLRRAIDLGQMGALDALRSLDAETDRFQASVEVARAKVEELLGDGSLGAPLRAELVKIRSQLEKLEREPVGIRLQLAGDFLTEVERARSELQTTLQDLANQITAGTTTPVRAAEASAAAFQKFREAVDSTQRALVELENTDPALAAKLQEGLDKLVSGAPQEKTDAGLGPGVAQGFEKTAQDLSNLQDLGARVGSSLASDLSSALVDVFFEGAESFRAFLREFLIGIAKMIVQALILRAILLLLGIPALPVNTGGKIPKKFDGGGQVPGPRVHADVVPAVLTPGEWVLNEAAANYYGDAVMSALNRRLIPADMLRGYSASVPSAVLGRRGFADGGGVASPVAPQSSSPTVAFVVGGEQELERLLRGGAPAMIRFMQENAGSVRASLGV